MSTLAQFEQRFLTLQRTGSSKSSTEMNIIPPTHLLDSTSDDDYHRHIRRSSASITTFFKSLCSIISFPSILPSCRWLSLPTHYPSVTPTLGRKVTGTLFGNRRGNVSFAVQTDLTSEPFLLLELGVSTSVLVKKMSSGVVRIALECEKTHALPPHKRRTLLAEPVWTMYCNGRNCGYAVSRVCSQSDWHVLSKVRSVSVGAGVIPLVEDGLKSGGESEGELLYMRARFERVVGTRDSEAFYMLNPDGNGGPELGIFLLRI
ncbi:protein MIZU-KUSSEI 1-like [Primulina huaijiensis]|uniref:protein MIZU-KUSSEI 1-like n=1 Tax=Primulina huaijiensis TaxID=1492673 RepID=UPI003CC760DF